MSNLLHAALTKETNISRSRVVSKSPSDAARSEGVHTFKKDVQGGWSFHTRSRLCPHNLCTYRKILGTTLVPMPSASLLGGISFGRATPNNSQSALGHEKTKLLLSGDHYKTDSHGRDCQTCTQQWIECSVLKHKLFPLGNDQLPEDCHKHVQPVLYPDTVVSQSTNSCPLKDTSRVQCPGHQEQR